MPVFVAARGLKFDVNDDLYAAVDAYLEGLFGGQDPELAEVLEHSATAGLPAIAVSPVIGRLLQVLALVCGARSVLEIGTLGGYSAIWLARGVPADGRVLSLEVDAQRAAVARDNIDRAGMADRVEVRVDEHSKLLPNCGKTARPLSTWSSSMLTSRGTPNTSTRSWS